MNKAILVWNITKDSEIKQTESWILIANNSIATNEFYKDKDGNKQQQTEFHNLTAFWKTAELFENHVKKGQKVLIEGKIKTRSREADDGAKRYLTYILVERLEFLGGWKKEDGEKDEWYEEEAKKYNATNKAKVNNDEISIEDIPF